MEPRGARGDADWLHKLWQDIRRWMRGRAIPAQVDDIASDVVTILIGTRPDLLGKASGRKWAAKVARNVLVDLHRTSDRVVSMDPGAMERQVGGACKQIVTLEERQQRRKALRSGLAKLLRALRQGITRREKQIIVRKKRGLTDLEIATQIHIAERSVRRIRQRVGGKLALAKITLPES